MRTDFHYKLTPTVKELLMKDLQSLSAPPVYCENVGNMCKYQKVHPIQMKILA